MSKKRSAEDAWGAEQMYEEQLPSQSYEYAQCQCDRPDKVQKASLICATNSTEMWGLVGQYVRKCSTDEYSMIS